MSTLVPKTSPSQIIDDVYRVASTLSGGIELASCSVPNGAEGGLGPHPCLTVTNSINVDDQHVKWKKELRKKEEKNWKDNINPLLNGYQRKAQQILEERIKFMCKKYGETSLAVLHLTFKENVSYEVAQERMNSLRTNVFSKRYRGADGLLDFATVCEKGSKNGRIHFHCLVVPHEYDSRWEYDKETGKRQRVRKVVGQKDFFTGTYKTFNPKSKEEEIHSNPACKAEWNFYRETLEKYGFGAYVRVEPLWSVKGGAKYFSKYVGKGHYTRDESMTGKQLIRFGSGFRQCLGPVEIGGVRFSSQQQVNWIGGVATGRRRVLGELVHATGLDDIPSLNHRYGPRWQHLCKDQMLASSALADVRMGAKSRDMLYDYALNKWGITLQFKDDGNQVIMGRDSERVYSLRELFEYALNCLMDRLEEVEEFQYDIPFQG